MNGTVASSSSSSLLRRSDLQPPMAKASLGEVRESDPDREAIGRCLERARQACGWNLNEFADRVPRGRSRATRGAAETGVDPSQARRWERGEDLPPLHRLKKMPAYWRALVVAFAHESELLRVRTTIEDVDVVGVGR